MHKPVKSRGVGVLDHFGDHHSLAGNRADDRNFAECPRPANAFRIFAAVMIGSAAMSVVPFAAEESFVNFDLAREGDRIAFHRGPPAMADVPASAPVSTGVFTEHHAPYLKRAKTLLCGHHQEADFEPEFERNLGVLKDRVRDHAEAIAVTTTAIFVLARPMKGPRLESVHAFLAMTARAFDAIGPTLVSQILLARLIGRKHPVE